MRAVVAAVALALLLAVPASAAAAGKPRVFLVAPTHAPRVDAPWPYAVVVTDARGRFVRARLHLQITFGGLPVGQVGRHAVDGLWVETLTWPKDAVGQSLALEVEATVGGTRLKARYPVTTRRRGASPASAQLHEPRVLVLNVHAPRSATAVARGDARWAVTCNVPGSSRTVSTAGRGAGKLRLPKPATGDCAVGAAAAGRGAPITLRGR